MTNLLLLLLFYGVAWVVILCAPTLVKMFNLWEDRVSKWSPKNKFLFGFGLAIVFCLILAVWKNVVPLVFVPLLIGAFYLFYYDFKEQEEEGEENAEDSKSLKSCMEYMDPLFHDVKKMANWELGLSLYYYNTKAKRERNLYQVLLADWERVLSHPHLGVYVEREYYPQKSSPQRWSNDMLGFELFRPKELDELDREKFVRRLYKAAAPKGEDIVAADGNLWRFLSYYMNKLDVRCDVARQIRQRYEPFFQDFVEDNIPHFSTKKNDASTPTCFFQDLGVPTDATPTQVAEAYQAKALKDHPDLPKNVHRVKECELLMDRYQSAFHAIMGLDGFSFNEEGHAGAILLCNRQLLKIKEAKKDFFILLGVAAIVSLFAPGWWLTGVLLGVSMPLISLFYFVMKQLFLSNSQFSVETMERIVATDDKLKKNLRVSPAINEVCRLNPKARPLQEAILKEHDMENLIPYLDDEYTPEQVTSSCQHLYDYQVELLFKLALTEDGISEEEWSKIQNLMEASRLSKALISFHNRRYDALRTEAHDDYSDTVWAQYERKRGGYRQQKRVEQELPTEYCYELLGLSNGASEQEVTKAYYALVKQYHPDLPQNRDREEECNDMMAKLNEAYERICG